ncbi:MAG TPA: MFS transporter [Stellaceae bacterium]|jgi:MFS family permease|nr:MFS transporter [Stellaceae bacterium]
MPAEIVEQRMNAAPEVRTQNRTLIFIAALASVFITAIESTIVSTAMPTVVASLGGFDLLSWVFTSYLLTQVVTVPIYGRLADLYGRKPILLFGAGLFIIGSILCGFAWSMLSLVLFRTVQGLGAGALMPVGRTLIGDIFIGPERARMQGVVSSVFIGAAVLGPMVGAFLATHTIWPMIFWINVPIALIAGAILIWGFREHIEKRRHRIDWGGALLIALGTGTLMFALAQTSSLGLGLAAALIVAAVVVLIVFVFYERSVPEPIWPMSLWQDRVASSGNLVSLGLGATTMGIAAYMPVYIQGVIGDSALVSGLALMAMSAAGPVGAMTAGQLMLRVSYRTTASAGAAIYIIGSIMMTALSPASGAGWAAASGLLMGLGIGMNNNTYLVAVQSESAWNQRGIATSALVFSRILGQAIGAAAFGGILNASLAAYLNGHDDLVTQIMTVSGRSALPAAIVGPVIAQFDHALHMIFYILVVLAFGVMAVGLMLPKGRGIRR